jgi:hypothetical protein
MSHISGTFIPGFINKKSLPGNLLKAISRHAIIISGYKSISTCSKIILSILLHLEKEESEISIPSFVASTNKTGEL